jgi:ergothioneine biosynthesis protein EgtB
VLAYRSHVDQSVLRRIARIGKSDAVDVLELGLQHEQQHQELILTDVKHLLYQNPLQPAYAAPTPCAARGAPRLSWVEHPGGVHEVGHGGAGFAFDNEAPRHRVYLEPFAIGSRLVTCREWLEFISDEGYRRPELWLSEGWAQVQAQGWSAPLYWERRGTSWRIFTLHGPRSLDPDEPVVHVSFHEADAYARWRGARLPTEGEWEIAASGRDPLDGEFAERGRYHPTIAGSARLSQLFGDVWEWTRSPYVPYPRYRRARGALGEYNGKFMCNQMVLRGGSCASPRGHVRATYRNFFRPDARWQFSGVRLARDR